LRATIVGHHNALSRHHNMYTVCEQVLGLVRNRISLGLKLTR
jgi:hypothetical protein